MKSLLIAPWLLVLHGCNSNTSVENSEVVRSQEDALASNAKIVGDISEINLKRGISAIRAGKRGCRGIPLSHDGILASISGKSFESPMGPTVIQYKKMVKCKSKL